MSKNKKEFDVVIIGAGPSGSIAAAKLSQEGFSILVIEKMKFPRFVIGESLLPQCMDYLDKVDLLKAIENQKFQKKDGASFFHNTKVCEFSFANKFTAGWDYTYQVKRAQFDQVLIETVKKRGVQVEFNASVVDFQKGQESQLITYVNEQGEKVVVKSRFVIDASGYGKVLPNLLDLIEPIDSKPRGAIFCHLTDQKNTRSTAANNIYIHDFNNNSAWLWSIPFSDNTASVGVVGDVEFIENCQANNNQKFLELINCLPVVKERFKDAEFVIPAKAVYNYSSKVKQLYGDGYVLCGNATEFLDPIFSSGVTMAIASAYKAAELISLQLNGTEVDWESQYSDYVLAGIDVFRSYVNAWYSGDLQTIFFNSEINEAYKKQISSVLAGYVWDAENPFVKKHKTILQTLSKVIQINQ